ncbi:bifunctional oligoribonuclease/PAP phosphatase NrnA [Paludicola sp. MB14-C6]|uniref:DHH family phosphoesterase n=1 Tax=Paludihabitans sp. MB14-C6 TaxID=3070656 RepID=UPI0027DE9CF2|nr:bifunctional oligoribonuclease/PAP phosphatase NrnA [Paludicola sp. MB14-C6]WMJ23012.1 bifunctional oligoribonuclease/PAP phosphatase NrnA [Paludicola sp. MB14-C6]
MTITKAEVVKRLLQSDNVLIITHKSPDGDTLGSAFALYNALKSLQKKARVECSDIFPQRFQYLMEGYEHQEFKPDYIVAVDVAAIQLFGSNLEHYAQDVDLCIDHHPSNELYAKDTYLVAKASATCEMMYDIICDMNIAITKQIADCLYTGLATDTGCFRFSNTTEKTHRTAADLFGFGANYEWINRILFETKSKSRVRMEQLALSSIEYYYSDYVALIAITQKMIEEANADESELDGVASIPRTIEGVEIGITMREKAEGGYKISIRTASKVDASQLCALFNGGGHKRAAGCFIDSDLKTTKRLLLDAIQSIIKTIE